MAWKQFPDKEPDQIAEVKTQVSAFRKRRTRRDLKSNLILNKREDKAAGLVPFLRCQYEAPSRAVPVTTIEST